MDNRLHLQTLLEQTLESVLGEGHKEVYFQPPASIHMSYPCIVFQLDQMNTKFANNNPYGTIRRYQITAIDRDPDSPIPEALSKLQRCQFNRFYITDNLNHFVFTIYY